MLLAFRVENFRSIGKEVVFNLEATPGKELKQVIRHPHGVLPKSFVGVLPLAILYGANGAGKSNVFLAAGAMRSMVLYSGAEASEGEGPNQELIPFKLNSDYMNEPTLMEISFLLDGVHYLYGFEATRERVTSEWLLAWPKGVEQKWFLRGAAAQEEGKSDWYFGPSWDGGDERGKLLAQQTRKDALYITVASRFNHPQAQKIVNWFKMNFRMIDHTEKMSATYTQKISVERPEVAAWVSKILNAADTGIIQAKTTKREVSLDSFQNLLAPMAEKQKKVLEKEIQAYLQYRTETFHQGKDGSLVSFDMTKDESHGTQRLFSIIGPLRNVLEEGYTVWIDELSTGLHHWLVRYLVDLFQNPKLNPNGAQLIITSHDPLLLDNTLVRRDQIFLAEKSTTGMTDLYSLAEFTEERRKPRIGAALSKQYLAGRFGGVPQVQSEQFLTWLPDPIPSSVSQKPAPSVNPGND